MNILRSTIVLLVLLVIQSSVAMAQNTVVVVPDGDGDLMPMVLPQEPVIPIDPNAPLLLKDAIGKPIIWNKGWDQNVRDDVEVDPNVTIAFRRLEPVFGYPGIIFTGQEIRQWGEQTYFNSPKKIYAKAVILVDKGSTAQGGVFEWSLNNQGFISFHNIVRKDVSSGWIGAWTDPRPGDKVWFFIMADNERYSSNPISFTWP